MTEVGGLIVLLPAKGGSAVLSKCVPDTECPRVSASTQRIRFIAEMGEWRQVLASQWMCSLIG
jgi:hypothetical protein